MSEDRTVPITCAGGATLHSLKCDCTFRVRMRTHHFSYYGRPTRQPYLLFSEFGVETYGCCASRSEWDDSRVRALQASAPDEETAELRLDSLALRRGE